MFCLRGIQAEVVAENTVGKPFESYRPDEDVVIASDSNSDSDCCFTDSSSSTSSENDFWCVFVSLIVLQVDL